MSALLAPLAPSAIFLIEQIFGSSTCDSDQTVTGYLSAGPRHLVRACEENELALSSLSY